MEKRYGIRTGRTLPLWLIDRSLIAAPVREPLALVLVPFEEGHRSRLIIR
jgi:hypothetical protein